MTRVRHGRYLAVGVLAGLLGGCAPTGLNHRLAIGTQPTASFGAEPGPGMASENRSSPRSAWSTTEVSAPIDGVVHGLTLRTRPLVSRRSKPDRVGAYPDPLGERDHLRGDTPWRAIDELGRAAWDAAFLGVRRVLLRAGGAERRLLWSPQLIWKRTPEGEPRVGTIGPRSQSPGTKERDHAATQ